MLCAKKRTKALQTLINQAPVVNEIARYKKNWNILELLNNKKSEKWCGDVCQVASVKFLMQPVNWFFKS